ncbi:hypothetical protein LTR70_007950 [Exophiala xenobiotica]|uniref:alpha-1,2-Mannosidase n=1 Tax=Lithohypha guttulata TaxID=1690604 RepID=A0ABR0K2Q8_9EURO|nr:hypothetical protein LTR24_007502 [Lithohypha guttulata]KAK5312868.1 hypothetical protein LTR70_007950 [Exophiala xenobiotica]
MLMTLHDASSHRTALSLSLFLFCFISFCCFPRACAGRNGNDNGNGDGDGVPGAPHLAELRAETEKLFYHGFENYMKHAFPEDELRPLTCSPLTRDRENPAHIEVNDVLGNYSLTLIDSLSTLAVLASSSSTTQRLKPLLQFQNGIKDLVDLYGDGTQGPRGQGKRARGFDLDSKVQVFETAIRGLGGLLSAHLFAVGDLPIAGYTPPQEQVAAAKEWNRSAITGRSTGIKWPNGMLYDGQLLRLAHDLGNRLVPAFWTSTGLPYPRVNLRHGIPFHARSPGNFAPEGQCDTKKRESTEVTETCSAGAGSLVLEFTVLSRLTADAKFEELAKRAFWAIWNRRSQIDLIGSGIDAETGIWQHSWTGIGAGVDSFFEYAFKSYVLLSGQPYLPSNQTIDILDPRSLFPPLSELEHLPGAFLQAWETAHSAIKRHIYRDTNFQHPHYIQVDLNTGAPRAFWVDALSAYYPGLLAMSGHVEEAIETHLVSIALWQRFSALPERYNMASGGIEGGLGWWVGRPELIESTWYLYRATEDPFYIYAGEMFLRDIKRRCWTRCGWTGIQNVVTGEKINRMESFFLGETAKYLFLLFDPDHPLNKLDAPFVFTTEGHPLIIPTGEGTTAIEKNTFREVNDRTCPAMEPPMPLTISNVAARGDMFHAASLARLHLMPKRGQVESVLTDYAFDHPSITLADVQSPSNWTHYPWTLPLGLVPHDAVSSIMPSASTFELSFPTLQNQGNMNSAPLQRVKDGILVNFLGGLRLSMVQDVPMMVNDDFTNGYRIHAINNVALGKDEKVFLAHSTSAKALNPQDPLFSRARDTTMLDIVVDLGQSPGQEANAVNVSIGRELEIEIPDLDSLNDGAVRAAWNSILTQISELVRDAQGLVLPLGQGHDPASSEAGTGRLWIPAITPTGVGAGSLPDWPEASATKTDDQKDDTTWTRIFDAGELCDEKVSASILKSHQVILIKRGNCSFSKKLSNIPTVHPKKFFQLVIVVDYESVEQQAANNVFSIGRNAADFLTRPLLDEPQTTSSGLPRQNLVPMVMVGGGEQVYQALKNAKGIGIKRRYSVTTQGIPIANLMIV